MSEYIGSRISLISKSDIKYIGTLHEINSDSHTVALESVTSYGTEGRKGNPALEIAGSDQVYEYIVFRGSDVKELTIVAPPTAPESQAPPKVPDDPAILGSARPAPQSQQHPQQQPPQQQPPPHSQFGAPGPPPPYPQQPPPLGYPAAPPPNAFPPPPRFHGPGGPHGFPGTPGAVPGYGMGFPPPPPGYYGPPPPGQGFPQQPPPPHFPPNPQMTFGGQGQQVNQPRFPPHPQQQQPPPIGSKQSTPQAVRSNAATPAQSTPPAPPKSVETAELAAPPAPASAAVPPLSASEPKSLASTAPASTSTAQPPSTQRAARLANRVAVPLPSANASSRATQPPTSGAPAEPPQSIADATQAATAAVAAAMAKLGPVNQGSAQPQNPVVDSLAYKVDQMRLPDQPRGRGRGRASGPRAPRRESLPKQIDVPKEDFDFESANAKFNKQDLVKEAIPANGAAVDGTAPANDDLSGDKEVSQDFVIPPKSAAEKGYDKKSSFFDNISSDLKDRVEQSERDATSIDGRTLRREERTKNMETFGQGSVDSGSYRGGYRGRGRGGRGYGHPHPHRGGSFRGGRGGYEPRGGGYRGRGGKGAPAEPAFA